jgi:hypothetical protein
MRKTHVCNVRSVEDKKRMSQIVWDSGIDVVERERLNVANGAAFDMSKERAASNVTSHKGRTS